MPNYCKWAGFTIKGRQFNIPKFAPIKYLTPDCIVTWSLCWLCTSSYFFTFSSHIWNPTNIHWVGIGIPVVGHTLCPVFTAAQQISIRSHIRKREVEHQLQLHNLHTYHVLTESELKCIGPGIVAETLKWHRGEEKPGQTPAVSCSVRVMSPSKQNAVWVQPVLEPNRT
jgi:hypothetical protein